MSLSLDIVSQFIHFTNAPVVMVSDGIAWPLVQKVLKFIDINSSKVEKYNSEGFIYSSESSYGRAIRYFKAQDNSYHRKLDSHLENYHPFRVGYWDDPFHQIDVEKFNEIVALKQFDAFVNLITKKEMEEFIEESKKLQLFLLAMCLKFFDKYYEFESEKKNNHFDDKYRLQGKIFKHELNKVSKEAHDNEKRHEMFKEPLTEMLLSRYRLDLEKNGLNLILYDISPTESGKGFTVILNMIHLHSLNKSFKLNQLYLLKQMAIDESWKDITFTFEDGSKKIEVSQGLSTFCESCYFTSGGLDVTSQFNESKAYWWVKENLHAINDNPAMIGIDYRAPEADMELGNVEDEEDIFEKDEYDVDMSNDNRQYMERANRISDENARTSDDFDTLDPADSDDGMNNDMSDAEEEAEQKAFDEHFKAPDDEPAFIVRPKLTLEEIADFLNRLDDKTANIVEEQLAKRKSLLRKGK